MAFLLFFTFDRCREILIETYEIGIPKGHYETQEDYFRTLLYWTTLQEDINYPASEGYEGRRMAFKRYIEALDTTLEDSEYSLTDVMVRANQRRTFDLLEIYDPPYFYY